MTDLDLHPAAEVVPEEVGGDGVEHVHLIRLEGDCLLVEVVPANKQYSIVQYIARQYITLQYRTVQTVYVPINITFRPFNPLFSLHHKEFRCLNRIVDIVL